jgi:hypothetical protein
MSETNKDKIETTAENKNVHDFIVQVESVYRGLGIPVLYGFLSILANKSVFFIAGRGTGKTRTINCIPDVNGTDSSKWDTFTLTELNNLCQQYNEKLGEFNLGVRNRHFVFRVEDFSTLSEYHREIFLTVCSKISSDGNYCHITELTPYLRINDCKLTIVIAAQPKIYSLLCSRYDAWETMSYDRFTKFIVLNPLREKTVDERFVPTLPKKMSMTSKLPVDVDLSKLVALFEEQVSEGRAYLYARDYAVAMAMFQGKERVEHDDVVLFHKMFSPYLDSFSRLQHREDLETSTRVSSGHMELLAQIGRSIEGVDITGLARSLRVTADHIRRCSTFLLEKDLVRHEGNRYHLSTGLDTFFNWYKATFSVKMSPSTGTMQDTSVSKNREHPLKPNTRPVWTETETEVAK